MSLSNRELYDYHDIDPLELMLIRATHHIWRLWRAERGQNGYTPTEERAFSEAIDTMVDVKRSYRAYLKAKRAEQSAKDLERLKEWRSKRKVL